MSAADPSTRSLSRQLSVVRGVCLLLLPALALLATVGLVPEASGAGPGTAAVSVPSGRPTVRLQPTLATPVRTPAAPPVPTPAARPAPSVAKAVIVPPGSAVTTDPVIDNSVHGCPVPDPSGSGGCITPALGLLMAEVIRTFGNLPVSCWDRRHGDSRSDHPRGRACDYTIGRIGAYPPPADVERGWVLALWLQQNADPLHVNYVIWQGYIWSRAHAVGGWRPYTGGGYYSVSGPTNGHYDHVHVSTVD